MYLSYYSLSLKPFEISPDPNFLWLGQKFREALAAMKYAITTHTEFVSLTGDIGTGKTTLVNALLNNLGDNTISVKITDPSMEGLDFFNFLADAFEIKAEFSAKEEFLSKFKHYLSNAYTNNKELVLIIEEAQRISQELLEGVRLLSNIRVPNEKPMTFIFVGQNEFNDILVNNPALRQQIAVSCDVGPLTETETDEYIMHRLKVAGSEKRIFSPSAVREVYTFSEGNPRLINIVCDLSLLSGYVEEKPVIEPEIVRECTANLTISCEKRNDPVDDEKALPPKIPDDRTEARHGTIDSSYDGLGEKAGRERIWRKAAIIASIPLVILAYIIGYIHYVGERNTELSSKNAQISELDKQLQAAESLHLKLKEEIEKGRNENAALQAQLSDLKNQEAAAESRIDQLQSRNAGLVSDLRQLQGSQERVTELQTAVAARDRALSQAQEKLQALSQAQEKLQALQSELDQAKNAKDLLTAELSSKNAQISELDKKLQAAESVHLKLENEIDKSKNEIAALKSQVLELEEQKASTKTSPNVVEAQERSKQSTATDIKPEQPNPTDIIDWVMKNKAK
jgi:type II secretory pathway predicted ATPase ExeA/predicted  nucleic acid-binding Zn-ribbon protein